MKDESTNIINALARKLQIKPGTRWLFFTPPADYLSALEPLPNDVVTSFIPAGNFDGMQLFVKNGATLTEDLKIIQPLLKKNTILWIAYPKKSSGVESDLEMMGTWDALKQYGLTTVAAISINEVWTGIRLKPEEQMKASDVRNEAIKKNEYAAYIDPDRKIVTLPSDLKMALEQEAAALANYNALSYSNRKEYVLWVLTAKQEKTRIERIHKAVEKLLAGKKNPAEK